MKKMIAAALLATTSTFALAMWGSLTGQWTEGMNRYCKYSNGKIITIGLIEICPLSID